MTDADVVAAWDVGWTAILTVIPPEYADEDFSESGRRRVAHLLGTDPGGAWVAADPDGGIIGVSMALIREDIWGYSLLGVHPEHHGKRIGTRLFERSLAYGDGTRAGIILSTGSPAAMRRYFRGGFRILPSICASGALNATRIPDGLTARPGDPVTDAATIDLASRHVRGASHRRDIPAMQANDGGLLVIEGEGFAVHYDGSPNLIAATNDAAARDLMWSCFAAARPGATVHVDFITAGNDWALDVSLAAGLTADANEGPVFVRGDIGPLAPYLPSGAYL